MLIKQTRQCRWNSTALLYRSQSREAARRTKPTKILSEFVEASADTAEAFEANVGVFDGVAVRVD